MNDKPQKLDIRKFGIVRTIKNYLVVFSDYKGLEMHIEIPKLPLIDFYGDKAFDLNYDVELFVATGTDIIKASLDEIVELRKHVTELEEVLLLLMNTPAHSMGHEDHKKVISALDKCYRGKVSTDREDWKA